MNYLQSITQAPLQQQTVALADGTTFAFDIQFIPMQYAWFISNLSYGDFVLNGIRVVNHPNLLFQWVNLIPFGIACFSTGNREPSLQEDFSTGASKLFLLSETEIKAYAAYIRMGVLPP